MSKIDEHLPVRASEAPRALRRSLTYADLVVYGLAYISPLAPLGTLGFVWQLSGGLIVLAYLLGAGCMYFTAKSYAVMTEAVPTAGSVYGFARDSLGPLPGFVAGWMILLDYLLIPALVYVLIAVALGTLIPGVTRGEWILLMAATTLAINWFGVTVTSRANFVAVAIQAVIVVGCVVLGLMALAAGKGTGRLSLAPVYNASSFEFGKIFSATSICILSFLGFDAISTLAEEIKGHDRRDVGRAIMTAFAISAAFFVGVTWVFGNLLPGIRIKDPAAATYELAAWAVAPWAAGILAWVYVGVVGFCNALPMQAGAARVLYAMGRDRQLPSVLARLHPRFDTPYVGMLVTTAISLGVALQMRNRLDDLTSMVNFGALSAFLLLHASVLARFAAKQRSRSWFPHWVVPLAGIAVVLAVLRGMGSIAVVVGTTWLAVGIVYGLALRWKRRDELRALL
jgi:amino acid transporter